MEREEGGWGLLGHYCDGIGIWELEVLSAGEEEEIGMFSCQRLDFEIRENVSARVWWNVLTNV